MTSQCEVMVASEPTYSEAEIRFGLREVQV